MHGHELLKYMISLYNAHFLMPVRTGPRKDAPKLVVLAQKFFQDFLLIILQ